MKTIILCSEHDKSKEKAEEIQLALGVKGKVVDIVEVFGTEVGLAIKNLLEPREFPCVIFVNDHLQGATVSDLELIELLVAEQQDIEEREFQKRGTEFLKFRLEVAKEKGREEVRDIIKEVADLPTLSDQARSKLEEKGVLLKK